MKDLSLKASLVGASALARKVRPYAGVLLFLLFAAIYGYLVLRINTLSNPAIDSAEVLTQAKATPTPRIDEAAAEQLQTLRDNSVNVQTLFEEGRTNPFDE